MAKIKDIVKSWGTRIKRLAGPISDLIKHKHRFVVLDSDTFKEKWSFQLSGINLFVTIGISMIVLVVLTALLIVFTPLREWIPGYSNQEMQEQTYRNAQMIDSLQRQLEYQEWMVVTLQDIIGGKTMPGEEAVQRHTDSLAALGITIEEYRRCQEVHRERQN